jgi:TetR/AcrR family transcriptional regulator, transcriptional repressor for nem operon
MKAVRTRQYILEKAAAVFNKKGFDGTSLADLEAETGLSKGALYGNFRDKETLAAQAFAHSTARIKHLMLEELKGISSHRGKLFALLDFFARYADRPPIAGGCPLMNLAVEADDNRISMRPVVAGEINRMVRFIDALIRKGIRSGEFKKDTDHRALAYTFFCALEGAIMFSRVERSREPMHIIVDHCKTKLDQITNPIWNKKG